jgi:hypothetical protein
VASVARNAFLERVTAFELALEVPQVRAGDLSGDFLRRGLTVAAFNLLEYFLEARLEELTAHINGGGTFFVDLPPKLQEAAIVNTLAVASEHVGRRRQELELPALRTYAEGVGNSLASVGRAVAISPLTWAWTGSNLSVEAFKTILRKFHAADIWVNLADLETRMGQVAKGQTVDVRERLDSLTKARHSAAHDTTSGVTTLWLRGVPKQIRLIALGFDLLASLGAHSLRLANPQFLADDMWITSDRLRIRSIKQRRRDYAEYVEAGGITPQRAFRAGRDGDSVFLAAFRRCADNEVVVRQNLTGEIVSWAFPAVD